jgi:hypothetical protein
MKASKMVVVELSELLDGKHPAVIIRKLVTADKGKIAVGQIVAIADGNVLPYIKDDETAGTAYGVATQAADTATGEDTAVNVLVHGTCKRALVSVVSGTDVVQADIDAIAAKGVWALN